jgi:RNA polymerase sigma factor (sigma-70 family)
MRAISIPARGVTRGLRPKRLLVLAGDETLVEQMRRGNAAAYEVVFERHGAGILAFCRHMLGGHEEAEDAVQHTFAAAFQDLQRDHSRDLALKPWLYAIARNRCTSVLRSRREHVAIGEGPATPGLAEQVERRSDLRALLRDVRELPEEQRAALLLAESGGLSHSQVAEVLGCEVARVKALIFRARSRLIERREARETPCKEIREQLANLRGGALRRTVLRHHLRECPGCRAYREQVRQQRGMLAAALPVAPSLGLKSGVLAAIGIGGGSAGGGLAAGAAGGGIAAGLGGFSASLGADTAVKVAAVCALAGGGAVAGEAVLDNTRTTLPPSAAAPAPEPAGSRVAQPAQRPAPPQQSRAHAVAVAQQAPSAAQRPVLRGPGVRSGAAGGSGPASEQALGKRESKSGHRIKMKTAAPTPAVPDSAHPQGRHARGPKIDAAPGGRGPVAAPPQSKPVKRGPPTPKPNAQAKPKPARKPKPRPTKVTKNKAPPAVTPAPEPKIKPEPVSAPPKEAKPPKEPKPPKE